MKEMIAPKNIQNKIEGMFLRYGLKSVTMDDIAKELGMSKKTLYQYYPNKKSLIKNIVIYHLEHREEEINKLKGSAENALAEWTAIFINNCNFLRDFNPYIIYDMKKYYPTSWKVFEEHKNSFIYDLVVENIKRGIKEGVYRKDLNPEILAKIYISRIEAIVDQDIFPEREFSKYDVFNEFINYHLRGIASEKGIEYLRKNKICVEC